MTEIVSARTRHLILAAVIATMFMSAVEGTIIATAMPTIIGELGGFQLFGWVFGAYLLPQAIAVPIYGRLADLHGRKPIFFIGSGLFLAGSLACGFAWNMPSLIGFRALQGIGAGALMPITQTIVADIYPTTERARVQSWLSSVWGISAVVGPTLGAVIVDHLPWAIVFWINLPLGAIALTLLGFCLKERVQKVRHRLDLLGAALLAVATSTLMLVLLQADQLGWWILPLLALSVASAWALIRHERVAPEPMLPPELWESRLIVVASIGSALVGAVMMGVIAFLPTYVQGVMQRSPFEAALGLLLLSLGWPITGAITARLIVQHPYRQVASVGGAVLALSSALLLGIRPDGGLVLLCISSFGSGLGLGLISLTFLLPVQASVGWHLRGAATSSVMFARIIGQSLGTAIMGAVFNLGLGRRLPGAVDPVATLMDPARLRLFAPDRIAALTDAVAASLNEVFLAVLVLSLALLAVARAMPAGTLSQLAAHRTVDGMPANGQISVRGNGR